MARKRKKLNAFGKGSKDRFVMLDYWLLESEAWCALSLGARCLYIEARQRFNGQNNGQISFSVREGVERLRVSKDTVTKWFRELEDKGFLRARQRGSFSYKKRHATEWIITAERYRDAQATRDFMRWKPEKQKPVLLRGTDGPNQKDRELEKGPQNTPDGPTERDRERQKMPSDGPTERDTYNIPGGGNHSGEASNAIQSKVVPLPPIPPFLDRREMG